MSERNRFVDYFNSNPFLYEFTDDGQVRLFNCRKKMLFILMQTSAFYETIKSLVNGFVNVNRLRLYWSDFVVTWSSFQNVFNFSISVSYLLLIRLSFYLMLNDQQRSRQKFEYLNFLRFDSEDDLVERHRFTRQNARNYLRFRRFVFDLIQLNTPLYYAGCTAIITRVLLAAYPVIPLHWLLLFTLPNSLNLLFTITSTFRIFNCFNLTFWTGCMFTLFKLKSLSHQKFALCLFGRRKNSQRKIQSISNAALIGFNEVLVFFKASLSDYNYTICTYFAGILTICFTFPYLLVFGNDEILSFLICLSLYVQSMSCIIWTVCFTNECFDKGFKIYGKFLHYLVPRCTDLRLKLKLSNFFCCYQKDRPFRYTFLDIQDYSHYFFIKFIFETSNIVLLLYQFNSLKRINQDF